MKTDKYTVDFAPDGKNYHTIKTGNISRLWDYFCFSKDIQLQCLLNKQARFRLVNATTKQVIGVYPK
jgi:hypothetical protein